jgi:Sec-independent protein translocase protein TatA
MFMKLNPMLVIFNPGGTGLILMLATALRLLSARKLPQQGKAFGPGIKEFKKATVNTSTEINMK